MPRDDSVIWPDDELDALRRDFGSIYEGRTCLVTGADAAANAAGPASDKPSNEELESRERWWLWLLLGSLLLFVTEAVLDAPTETAHAWVRTVRAAITGRGEADPTIELGDADALRVVNNRPARVKCALLAWETLDEALTLAAAIESRTHTADGDA